MTASKKQIKANRKNAKKSTGPKTEQGKAIVSQNGTTFGLYSKKLIINSNHHSEDKVDYELLVENLRSELNPQSYVQEYLIKKIANCLWRSQRVALAETAHINKQLNKIEDKIENEQFIHSYSMKNNSHLKPLDYDSPDSEELSNLIGINSIPDKNFATRILYYEMSLDRQLTRTYELLLKIQRKEELEKKERAKNNAIPNSKANSL